MSKVFRRKVKKEGKMLRNSRLGISVMMVILVAVLSLAGCKEAAPVGPQEGIIKVGFLVDLTGPTAAANVPLTGVAGHMVETIVVDTRYDNDLAVSGFEKLVNQDKVHLVFCGSAHHSVVIKPLCDRYRIPVLAPTEYAVLLPHTPDSFMFGIIPHYADMYRCSLTWIKDNWKGEEPPRIGIMGLDIAFSKSVVKPIKWMLENELHWPIVAEEWMTMTTTDVTSQVTNLKNADCDYVLMPLTGAPQLIFQKTAYAAGLTESTQLVDIFITMMMTFRQLDPEATTGLMSHSPTALLQMADEVEVMALIDQIHKEYRPKAPDLDWVRGIGFAVQIWLRRT
ncbi:hypothetical protein ES703_38400 [subsurface metagenome]